MTSFSDLISLHRLKTEKSFIHSDFPRRIRWRHFAEIMVFSNEEKVAIKNDYLERGWNAYKICEEHPTKSWNRVSVCRLSEKISRRYFYGWKSWFRQTTNNYHQKNENPIESLISS